MGNCAGIKNQSAVVLPPEGTDALQRPKPQPGMQSWNDMLLQRYQNEEFKKCGPPSNQDIYEMLSNRKLKSGLFLEVKIHSNVPINGVYSLHYDFKYSNQSNTWAEEDLKVKDYVSKPVEFEYSY